MTGKAVRMLVVRAIGLGLGLVACSGHAAAESWRDRPLVDCSFGYSAEVCASDLNPGFEFIPVDGPILLTGETLEADAVVHTFRVEVELAITGARDTDAGPTLNDALSTIEAVLGHPRGWTARRVVQCLCSRGERLRAQLLSERTSHSAPWLRGQRSSTANWEGG